MNQYELKNTAEKIEGYFLLRANETPEQAFEKAKEEYISVLKHQIGVAEELSLEQYKTRFPEESWKKPSKYLLQEDDCAPDATHYFIKNMKEQIRTRFP